MVSYLDKTMVQQGQHKQQLSQAGKRQLADQLGHAPSVEAATQLVASWDTAFALQTLAELYHKPPLPKRMSFRTQLVSLSLGLSPVFFLNPWLLLLAPFFLLVVYLAHPNVASRRQRIRDVLYQLLDHATPSMLPAVLDAAIVLGKPDDNPRLLHALIRFLPFLNTTVAQELTPSQHQYLLRLLQSSDKELLIAVLLALGTLGDPRDTHRVRYTAAGRNERVREAKRECLELLQGANTVS
jgi:hypothetical protein